MQKSWLAASVDVDAQLHGIFQAGDDDGNGVLDLEEFNAMIASCVSEEVLHAKGLSAAKLYSLCLEESEALAHRANLEIDEDGIYPHAFVNVMRGHGLDRSIARDNELSMAVQDESMSGVAAPAEQGILVQRDAPLISGEWTRGGESGHISGSVPGKVSTKCDSALVNGGAEGGQGEGLGGMRSVMPVDEERIVSLVLKALDDRGLKDLGKDLQSNRCRLDQLQALHEDMSDMVERLFSLVSGNRGGNIRPVAGGVFDKAPDDVLELTCSQCEDSVGQSHGTGNSARVGHEEAAASAAGVEDVVVRIQDRTMLSPAAMSRTNRQENLEISTPVNPISFHRKDAISTNTAATDESLTDDQGGVSQMVRQSVSDIVTHDLERRALVLSYASRMSDLKAGTATPTSTHDHGNTQGIGDGGTRLHMTPGDNVGQDNGYDRPYYTPSQAHSASQRPDSLSNTRSVARVYRG